MFKEQQEIPAPLERVLYLRQEWNNGERVLTRR